MTEQLGFDFGPPEPATPGPPEPATPEPPEPATPEPPEPTAREPAQADERAPAGPPERPATHTSPETEEPESLASRPVGPAPALVRALAAASARYVRDRKLVVGRTRGEGRELLRQLALRQGSWVGFEVTTVLPLAVELAGPELARDRLRLLDAFEQQAILDEAIDAVLVQRPKGPLSALAEGVGFRAAVREGVLALRAARIEPPTIRGARLENREKQEAVARILSAYVELLRRGRRVDDAGVLARAVEVLKSAPSPGPLVDRRVLLLPGLPRLGLPGSLVSALQEAGAEVLETDPVVGLPVPRTMLWAAAEPTDARSFLHAPGEVPAGWRSEIEVFAASGVTDELREVLRRIAEAGLHWDEAEIVTPDPVVYGSALHVLSETLDVPVSFGVGLPVARTRPGRVVSAWFRWIEGGFGADVIRTLLAAGDLVPPRSHGWFAPARLARRLRRLRIGWGRDRYLRRIGNALKGTEAGGLRRHEGPEQAERRRERTGRELRALEAVLKPTLAATPRVPDRLETEPVSVSPAQLARGLRAFLRHVPVEDNAVDATALEGLLRRLERIEATLDRRTSYRAAAAILQGHLQFRVPAPRAEGRAPWSSAGGHLYLTDLAHGGTTGRRATFVVGLDANRFPGAGLQDPLLLDGERWTLGKGSLSRSADRLQESAFRFAALLARLRGTVTLSYSAWDPAEARVVPPALQALLGHRLGHGRPQDTFEDLHRALGAPAGAVPRAGGRLDERDVWLASLARDGRLLHGTDAVRRAYPALDAGLRARALRADPTPNAHNGRTEPRPEILDPRRNPERVLSASRLEALGRCPRKYLFSSVLRIRVPDDPELDPERWLDPLQRGDLLHRVYERALRELRERGLNGAALEDVALQVLEAEADRSLEEVPTPSRAVQAREMVALRRDVRAFAEMVRPRVHAWEALELHFGLGDDEPVPIAVEGGGIRLRGAVDRIDRMPEGLVVIDYKTGKARGYEPGTGAFDGGRRLQNFLYFEAVSHVRGERVVRMQYEFPTHRGQNHTQPYGPLDLASGGALIGLLLDQVAAGRFFPTDTPNDCLFCDFRDLCGVRDTRQGLEAPLADWSAEAQTLIPELHDLRRIRQWEG